MSSTKEFQLVLKRLQEELGTHRVKNFKGGGSSQGNYVHAERKGLGELDPFGVDVKPKKKDTSTKAVKISKAFLDLDVANNSPQEVYTEDEAENKKLNEVDEKAWSGRDGSGVIVDKNEIRGPNSQVPYNKSLSSLYIIGDFVDFELTNIVWREGDPYLYRYYPRSQRILVIAGPDERNIGKQFSISSRTAQILARDKRYKSIPDNLIDNLRSVVKLKPASKTPSPVKTTKQTTTDLTVSGKGTIQIEPISDNRKEQAIIINFPKIKEGLDITIYKINKKVFEPQSMLKGSYKDELSITVADSAVTFSRHSAEDKSPNGFIEGYDVTPSKSSAGEPLFEGTPLQTIRIPLQAPGSYQIVDKLKDDNKLFVVFTLDKAFTKKAKKTEKTANIKLDDQSRLPSANIWRSSIRTKKPLDRDMKAAAKALGRVRPLGAPWKAGVQKIRIITSDSKAPSTATDNIIRYELNDIKIPNPKFAGEFGNSKRPNVQLFTIVQRWLLRNGYLNASALKAKADAKRFKPKKKKVKEGIGDVKLGDSASVVDVPVGSDISDDESSVPETIAKILGLDTDVTDSNSFNIKPRSTIITPEVRARVLKISDETGIKPEAIYGIEMTESSGDPSGLAFNDHIFRKHLTTAEENSLADKAGISSSRKNRYGSDAAKTFDKAKEINPEAAIKGGAWGWYQVLGETSLELYNNDPDAFMAAFDANPMLHSIKSFIYWVKNKGSSFINAINNDNHEAWVKMYYGPAAFKDARGAKYVKRYVAAKNHWLSSDIS